MNSRDEENILGKVAADETLPASERIAAAFRRAKVLEMKHGSGPSERAAYNYACKLQDELEVAPCIICGEPKPNNTPCNCQN